MAKAKVTKAPQESTPSAPAGESVADKAKRAEGDTFTRVMDDQTGQPKKVEKRIAPQATVIINAIEAAGPSGITRKDLCEALTGVLVTRQPVGRIVSYYQKLMQEVGAVTVEKS